MKKILFSIMALLAIAGTSRAQTNALSVADISLPQNGKAKLVVSFEVDAPDKYTGFQFNLDLPSELEFVMKKETGTDVAYTKGDCFDETHSITANLDEGLVKVAGLSANSDPLTKTSGIFLTFTIKAKDGVDVGTVFTGKIKDILIAPVLGEKVALPASEFKVTITEPIAQTVLDETDTSLPADKEGANVKVVRSITANQWNTICLPFAMTNAQVKAAFGDDVQLGDFTGCETTTEGGDITTINVKFATVDAIEANHPYIIKVSSDISEFEVEEVDIAADEDEASVECDKKGSGSKAKYNYFIGVLKAGDVEELENALIINSNKFWYVTGTKTFKAFRGYFDFYVVLASVEDASAPAINITIGNETTNIKDIKSELSDDFYYNLGGQRVENPGKGLYIQNGKKVIIK